MNTFRHFRPLAVVILLASCSNEQQPGVNSPLAASVAPKQFVIPKNSSLCFEQVSGNRNQDTVRIRLNFHGDQVTGNMATIPDGKDARTGGLSGLLLQQDIKARWTYMQEGIQDSLDLDFRLGDNELLQKPLVANALDGRLRTDTNAGYTVKMLLVDCK